MTGTDPDAQDQPHERQTARGKATVGATGSPASRRIASEALFRGARELQIEHRAEVYRLRITGLDKLILTK